MFVVGAGLSTLETGADNFLSICGPPRYSEIRLNLAQGVQGVGSFVAPLLASRVFFADTVDTKQGLRNVQVRLLPRPRPALGGLGSGCVTFVWT